MNYLFSYVMETAFFDKKRKKCAKSDFFKQCALNSFSFSM